MPTYAWNIYNRGHELLGLVESPNLITAAVRIGQRNHVPPCEWQHSEHELVGVGPRGHVRVRIAEVFPPTKRKRKAKP